MLRSIFRRSSRKKEVGRRKDPGQQSKGHLIPRLETLEDRLAPAQTRGTFAQLQGNVSQSGQQSAFTVQVRAGSNT